MKKIQIEDKTFEKFIPASEIEVAVERIASQINAELQDKDPVFLGILNGSFMFASDLFKKLHFPVRITFLKVASYEGTQGGGTVKKLIGVNEDLKGQTVVILEDIVDTGNTLKDILNQLAEYEPREVKIATLFYKPEACREDIVPDYVAMEIPNDFIVGYGLDYNGYGRNFDSIYKVCD